MPEPLQKEAKAAPHRRLAALSIALLALLLLFLLHRSFQNRPAHCVGCQRKLAHGWGHLPLDQGSGEVAGGDLLVPRSGGYTESKHLGSLLFCWEGLDF